MNDMRSSCAIYVDVGYLISSAATRVTGTSLRRGVHVNHAALIDGLIAAAEQDSGLPLLRVNWYDSGVRPGGMPDIHQEEIGLLPRVKLRLGRLSYSGEQKGVDLRIGLDLATQGRGRIVDVMYLVSGDDDLSEAVEEAQGHGVQVIILAVPAQSGRPHAVAKHLHRTADALILIDAETIDRNVLPTAMPAGLVPEGFARPRSTAGPNGAAEPVEVTAAAGPEPTEPAEPVKDGSAVKPVAAKPGPTRAPDGKPTPSPAMLAGRKASTVVPPPAPTATPIYSTSTGGMVSGDVPPSIDLDTIDVVARQVVSSWCASATPDALAQLRRGRPSIPSDLDRTLLLDLASRSDVYDLDDVSRYALRDRFWELIDQTKVN